MMGKGHKTHKISVIVNVMRSNKCKENEYWLCHSCLKHENTFFYWQINPNVLEDFFMVCSCAFLNGIFLLFASYYWLLSCLGTLCIMLLCVLFPWTLYIGNFLASSEISFIFGGRQIIQLVTNDTVGLVYLWVPCLWI